VQDHVACPVGVVLRSNSSNMQVISSRDVRAGIGRCTLDTESPGFWSVPPTTEAPPNPVGLTLTLAVEFVFGQGRSLTCRVIA
jgi:hypothetical protein